MKEKRRRVDVDSQDRVSYTSDGNFTTELRERKNLESLILYSKLPGYVKEELKKMFNLEKAEICK